MEIQSLSHENLADLTRLVTALWPDCNFDEELATYQQLINAENDICYLVKEKENYIAFMHVSARTDYVEGATSYPVAYIEALYVKPAWQRLGVGNLLLTAGTLWGKQKACKELASDTECNNSQSIAFHEKMGFEEANRVVCFVKKI